MLLIRMLMTERSWKPCGRSVIQFRLPKICSWNPNLLPYYSNTHWFFYIFGFYCTFLLQKYQKNKKSKRACKSISHTVIPVTWYACPISRYKSIKCLLKYFHSRKVRHIKLLSSLFPYHDKQPFPTNWEPKVCPKVIPGN